MSLFVEDDLPELDVEDEIDDSDDNDFDGEDEEMTVFDQIFAEDSVDEEAVEQNVEGMSWNVAGTVRLVKEFEGCRLTAYKDSVGVLTIGYGHTGLDVKPGMTITQAKADQLLEQDLAKFNACVSNNINRSLNPNQVGALMSWSFNVGCGSLQSSTLRRRMNAGENLNTVASEELPKWNKAGGKVLPGLTRRRAAEVAFFKS
jgi:lysozyme